MFQRFTKAGTHNPQTPSTSDSPTHSAPTCWDVFLSFRGEDTRNNFTDHLHQTLLARGIQTFKDDLGLHRGEVISDALLAAIRESKTYVVVLSENYASIVARQRRDWSFLCFTELIRELCDDKLGVLKKLSRNIELGLGKKQRKRRIGGLHSRKLPTFLDTIFPLTGNLNIYLENVMYPKNYFQILFSNLIFDNV